VTTPKPFFIAYRLTDPMVSPKIKRDESLVDLLDYLYLHHYRWHVYGPAIYYVPVIDGVLADIKTAAIGIGIWMGGRKIRLFEFVEPPPAPGVEFIRQTEFIEGSEHDKDGGEEEVRDDGPGVG
jgi:hypothetical protein